MSVVQEGKQWGGVDRSFLWGRGCRDTIDPSQQGTKTKHRFLSIPNESLLPPGWVHMRHLYLAVCPSLQQDSLECYVIVSEASLLDPRTCCSRHQTGSPSSHEVRRHSKLFLDKMNSSCIFPPWVTVRALSRPFDWKCLLNHMVTKLGCIPWHSITLWMVAFNFWSVILCVWVLSTYVCAPHMCGPVKARRGHWTC